MKIKIPSPILFSAAVLCCAALSFSAARADDEDNQQGGDISGTESLDVEVLMTPTVDAPPGSSIKASLEADDEDGVTQAKLKLESQGLPPGTYSVGVTLKSDGSTMPLGTFTVAATPTPTPSATPSATPTATPTASPGHDDDGEDEDEGDDDSNNDGEHDSGHHDCEFGDGTSLPFPAGFDPFNIATIVITDANGVVLFTADLTNIATMSSMNFTASVKAIAGAANPAVTGTAMLTSAATRGKGTGSLQLSAHGLPPKMPLTFAVNGTPVKNLTSNKRGDVNVSLKSKGKASTLPAGISVFKVTSVGLHDKTGKLIVGASF